MSPYGYQWSAKGSNTPATSSLLLLSRSEIARMQESTTSRSLNFSTHLRSRERTLVQSLECAAKRRKPSREKAQIKSKSRCPGVNARNEEKACSFHGAEGNEKETHAGLLSPCTPQCFPLLDPRVRNRLAVEMTGQRFLGGVRLRTTLAAREEGGGGGGSKGRSRWIKRLRPKVDCNKSQHLFPDNISRHYTPFPRN